MYNSISKKINLNDLSSTSSDFISDYHSKYNKINLSQKGGNRCSCPDMFDAIKNKKLELILYILEQNNCCFKCKDSNGNTILHLLVPFYEQDDKIKNAINNLLKSDCTNFINIQNNQGQTPLLLAVMNDLDDLAELMENADADPSIEDNDGNFVASKEDNENNNENNDEFVTIPEPESNILNIFNMFVSKPEIPKQSELTATKDRKSVV